jgi:hypothetical protein
VRCQSRAPVAGVWATVAAGAAASRPS